MFLFFWLWVLKLQVHKRGFDPRTRLDHLVVIFGASKPSLRSALVGSRGTTNDLVVNVDGEEVNHGLRG